MDNSLYQYLLILGDNSMILGHRLSELCGHGPTLETDIALTNISLDLFGQVRSYFQYAAKIADSEQTEDSIAFLRTERKYRNVLLVEQENVDFAHVIVRQFLFDGFHKLLLEQLMQSKDETISAIAHKSIKESKYHYRFSGDWLKRLGDGTEVSHKKAQDALNKLYPFTNEFFLESDIEKEMSAKGIGPNLNILKETYYSNIHQIIAEANLTLPIEKQRVAKGKLGYHTENLGYILAELQYMQRTYPNMQW